MSNTVAAIDVSVNFWTPEWIRSRPNWGQSFFTTKMHADPAIANGLELEETIAQMDEAGIEMAFLIAGKAGREGLPGCYHVPYEMVARAVDRYPKRFRGLAGVSPYDGMKGVAELQSAITQMGFVGAHCYPHWFELAPDHAKYYPFYAKCCELGVPFLTQVGQSMVYEPRNPCRSVGRPITLDAVACDFPELKLVGIHIGIPWTDEMIAMAWKHSNVFIVADAHSPKYWPQSFVSYVNSYGREKVIFGTDFPVLGFKRTITEIGELGLRDTSYRNLVRDNAIRVFGLNLDRTTAA